MLQPDGESRLVFLIGSVLNEWQLVEVTARTLEVPRSRMCVVSLGRDHPWELAEYGGLRVIM